MDQPKIQRMLRLLALLSSQVEYTVDELAERLGMSQRTIYRYIDTFRDAGFSVEKVRDYVYRLTTIREGVADLSDIVYFSPEEAYIVNRLIDGLDADNALRSGLRQKLAAIYDRTSIAEVGGRSSNARKVQLLVDAIRDKRVVHLHGYASSRAGKTKDYRVEPFSFAANYASFWAFDLADNQNKRFKIARLEEVELTVDSWTMAYAHHETPMDAFRIHGEQAFHVVLRMNNIARNLLVEEYPLTEADIREDSDRPGEQSWIYGGTVRGMEGVGRFVLGLEANIDVLEGEELKSYLRQHAEHIITSCQTTSSPT